jgi:hypothetical protein
MEDGIDDAHTTADANTTTIAGHTSTLATHTSDIATNASDISDLDAEKTDLSTLTTKGDLYVRNASAVTRQAVGTNGQVLAAASGQATGLAWTTPAQVIIATYTGNGSDTTLTFSSIPQTYKHLKLEGRLASGVGAATEARLRFNADTGTNYHYTIMQQLNNTFASSFQGSQDRIFVNVGSAGGISLFLPNYTTSTTTPFSVESWGTVGTAGTHFDQRSMRGRYARTDPLTDIRIFITGGATWNDETELTLYGVN